VIGVDLISGLKTSEPSQLTDDSCGPLHSPFVIFFVLFDSSYRDIYNSTCVVVIGVSVYFQDHFIYFLFFFISPISSQTTRRRDGRIKERKKIKWYWRHSETPMTTSPVLLERSRQDEFNDTKKSYKQWMKWVIRAIQSYQDSLASASLVWPTPITDNDFPWYRCILLVEIFLTVLVMLSLEFWCVFKFFFSLFLLSYFLKNLI
jgi:hypothetical protein